MVLVCFSGTLSNKLVPTHICQFRFKLNRSTNLALPLHYEFSNAHWVKSSND